MILTRKLWDYITDKQVALDATILKKAKFEPDLEDRKLAFFVEVAEFIKEWREEVKWWSVKPNDNGAIIEEAIDCKHFAAGIRLVRDFGGNMYEVIRNTHDNYELTYGKLETAKDVRKVLRQLQRTDHETEALAVIVYLLEHLGFTEADLKAAYDAKNAENYQRVATGY